MGVLGVGGLFFRAQDPEVLTAWYRDMLGVGAGCVADGGGEADPWAWKTLGGPVVFAPFQHDTDYLPAEKAWMLNLRVSDLAGLLAHLRANNIEIIEKDEWNSLEAGRFARIHDPEGNAVELWEPPA